MSSNDWQEVKRLAADFQRAQLSSNLQRLTEANCVEIITKLQKSHLLDIVFTNDGKTFITRQHLLKEIKDELHVHGGRISSIDVAKLLNVDVGVVSSLIQEMLKADSKLHFILGQLIDQSCITNIAEDINEKLQREGFVSIIDLTRTYDLPGDFVNSIIKQNIGKVITNTKQDKSDTLMYYTYTYLARTRAIIKGTVLAITKPTPLTFIMTQSKTNELLFHSLIDSLIDLKQIPGFLTDRSSVSCTYIPNVYIKYQNEFITNSFRQNGYLDYGALLRNGISEPKAFISKVLVDQKLIYLDTGVIGQQIFDHIEAAVDDSVICSNLWIDLSSMLPTSFDIEDIKMVVKMIMEKNEIARRSAVFSKTFIVSNNFLNALKSKLMDTVVIPSASRVFSSGEYESLLHKSKISEMNDKAAPELSRKDERKRRTTATVGKSGGGTRGRETKVKSVKKKYGQKSNKQNESDEGDDNVPKTVEHLIGCKIVSLTEVSNVISEHSTFTDSADYECAQLVDDITNYFYPLMMRAAVDKCNELYAARLADLNVSRRKTHAALHDNILSHYDDIKLYQKGIKQLANSEDIEQQMNKYLLKTTATALVNACFDFFDESDEPVKTAENRMQILNKTTDKDIKESFANLHKSLNGTSVDELLAFAEDTFSRINIMMKKLDKKKEKALLESHKKALLDKLAETDDPPLVFHLVCTILFQEASQTIIVVPGRFVSNIMNFLKPRLINTVYAQLQNYHSLVLKTLTATEKLPDIMDELNKLTPSLLSLVFTDENLFKEENKSSR